MKYIVSLQLDGRMDIEVDAPDFETAKQSALAEFSCMDKNELSKMEVLEADAVNAEDENGELHDY